jgi:hypothetical protein
MTMYLATSVYPSQGIEGVTFRYHDGEAFLSLIPYSEGGKYAGIAQYWLVYQAFIIAVYNSPNQPKPSPDFPVGLSLYANDVSMEEFAGRLRAGYRFAYDNQKALGMVWDMVELCKGDLEQLETTGWPLAQ